MTTTTAADWLVQAEQEYAAERAEQDGERDVFAAERAKDVNEGLAKLGIAPLTPASTDGRGKLIPAQLTAADERQRFFSVYASYDEEERVVYLLVGDYHPHSSRELQEAAYEISNCDAAEARRRIVQARREGPKPKPLIPEQPSVSARAIVAALDNVRAALDDMAHFMRR